MSLDANMPTYLKAILTGVAGMVSTTLLHPLDLIKVRIQIHRRHYSFLEMVYRILSQEGYRTFYCGVSAGLLRQATFIPTRVMVYQYLFDFYKSKYNAEPPLADNVKLGVMAGLAGAFVSVPAEVASVRMIALCTARLGSVLDHNDYVDDQLHSNPYKGTWNALRRIATEEGFTALWRGGVLTACRTILITSAHIGSYSKAREELLKRGASNDFRLHVNAAIVSSFFTAVFSLPVDLVKTRYQVKQRGVTTIQIFLDVVNSGVIHLWAGLYPYFSRLLMYNIIIYAVLEHMNLQYHELRRPETQEEYETESLRWE